MISVITSTHNHGQFLKGAIDSVRNQTYKDFEHIIIDSGSIDNTNKILSENKDVKSYRLENVGQAAALNFGLSKASGALVAFLDADDEFLPDHLNHLLETIGSGNFALGRFILSNCSPNPSPMVRDFYNPTQQIEVNKIEVITGVLFGKKELIRKAGGFRPVPSLDTDLFNRIQDVGYQWNRAEKKTYKYNFGRVDNSIAIREMRTNKYGG